MMKMFLKEDVLNEAVTAFLLIKVKVSESSNQLAIGDVKLTTATEALLKSCSVDKAAKEKRIVLVFFWEWCRNFERRAPESIK